MEGMLKSIETKEVPQVKVVDQKSVMGDVSNIHPEFYRYFNINPIDKNEQFETVSKWALENSKNIGEALSKVKGLERKLGAPGVDDTRLTKLYNYVRTTNSLKNTKMSMNGELNSIKERFAKEMSSIKASKAEKMNKIKAEIGVLEAKHRDVYKSIRNRSKLEMDKIRSVYQAQLTELKSLQGAYGGNK